MSSRGNQDDRVDPTGETEDAGDDDRCRGLVLDYYFWFYNRRWLFKHVKEKLDIISPL
jgi:hypothetical protein